MTQPAIRIAVDAMGGDFAPREIVKGTGWPRTPDERRTG